MKTQERLRHSLLEALPGPIIVTGGEGFVGKALTKAEASVGSRVIPLDMTKGFDVTDFGNFSSLIKNPSSRWGDLTGVEDGWVIHLAALLYVPYSYDHPREVLEVNVRGTWNVCEYCRKTGAGLIYASSYIYGPPDYLPVDEKHPIHPVNPYMRSKYLGEEVVKGFAEEYGIKSVIVRPFNIYGPGQKGDLLIPTILSQIEKGEVTLRDPRPKRDFLFIDDMVTFYRRCMRTKLDENPLILNAGSGKSAAVREVAEKLVEIAGGIPLSFSGEKRKVEVPDCYASIEKAASVLGWKPKVPLEEGLRRTYRWWKENFTSF